MDIFKSVFNLNDGYTFYLVGYKSNKDIPLILYKGKVRYYHPSNPSPLSGNPVEIDILEYILNHPESVFVRSMVTNDVYNIINALAIIYPTAEYIKRVDDNTLVVSNSVEGDIEVLPSTLNNMFKFIKCGRVIKINDILKAVNDYKDKQLQNNTYESKDTVPDACKFCTNHPSNGGSGICNCTLGGTIIYCSNL